MRTLRLLMGIAMGIAALIPFAVPGFASPPGAEQFPSSNLVLTTRIGFDTNMAWLRCEPTGGDHPRADEACADLLKSNGDVLAVEDIDSGCDGAGGVFEPATVTAHGTWRGNPVHFESEYTNLCEAVRDTGRVFLF